MVALTVPTLLPAQARVDGWAGPGSRIRVAAPALSSDPIYGRLVVLGGDSLVMTSAADARLRLELSTVHRVEVSEGRERLRWGAIAGLGGLIAGMVIGGKAGGQNDVNGLGALAGGVAGMIVGLPLGALGGAVFAPERWRTAWVPRP
jgi:hypothetical protein